MIFWIACAALTFLAVLAVLLPYLKRAGGTDAAQADDGGLEIYKDQLREIDGDLARGQISADDAEAARVEVSRRILRLNAAGDSFDALNPGKAGRLAVVAAAIVIPAAAWIGYTATGSPSLPDQPFATRLEQPAGEASIEVLIAKTEAHLAANPKDGKGWEVIAPVYLRTGQFGKAVEAYGKANEILGPSVRNEIGLGEALAGTNGGMIGADSLAAFERAAKLAPDDPQPKILIATALAQKGSLPEAKAAFEAILAGAPKDAPWRAIVEQSVAQLDAAIKNPSQSAQPGPSQAEVDSAAAMSAGDRTAMIEGMVAKLDARLTDNPADKDGWLRLIRSYAVLNKPDEAKAALVRARAGLAADPAALSEVKALAAEMGLETP